MPRDPAYVIGSAPNVPIHLRHTLHVSFYYVCLLTPNLVGSFPKSAPNRHQAAAPSGPDGQAFPA